MKQIIKFFVLCVISMFSILSYAQTPGQRLQTLLNTIHTMQGHFTQQLYNGQGQLVRSSSGSIALQRPGRFRWQTDAPSQQLMVADGKSLWIYDRPLAQVTVQPVRKAAGSTPMMMLSSSTRLLTTYFIVQYYKDWFFMRPRYGGQFLKMIKF